MVDPNVMNYHLDKIKKPSISMDFAHNDDPNSTENILDSFIGGHPYIDKHNEWPTCHTCQKDMVFLMQLREKDEKKNIILNTLFYCDCQMKDYSPSFSVIKYTNPKLEDLNVDLFNQKLPLTKLDIIYFPNWDAPNWLTLPLYSRELAAEIVSKYGDAIQSRNFYEDYRYENEYVADDPYNIIGGYPEFKGDPKKIKCNCCNQFADFFFQFEPPREFGVDFDGAVLYCFRCPRSESFYFIFN